MAIVEEVFVGFITCKVVGMVEGWSAVVPVLRVIALHIAKLVSFRISDQARGPAEFKHIIKRRKRN